MQNLPIFADQADVDDVGQLESGTQTIIPDYSFDCNGTVTRWGAFVERPGGMEMYTLDFQVWRRSGGGQGTTGEYDFVGSNRFQSVSPAPQSQGQILRDVPVEQQIKVRPGDVIGLHITTSSDNGVELKQQDTSNGDTLIIWFATSLTAALSTRIGVGSTSGYELMSTTTAVPVITAVVVPSTPSPSPTPSPTPTPLPSPTPLSSSSGSLPERVLATASTVQPPPLMITRTGISQMTGTSQTTGISQTTQTLQTQAPVQFSAPSIPQPSSFLPSPNGTTDDPVGSGLPVGVTVAIVLIVIVLGVLILVFMLALAWRRRSKKPPENPELVGN